MRVINAAVLTDSVRRMCVEANYHLPDDVSSAIEAAQKNETWPLALDVLDKITENHKLAAEQGLPICQDTGMACVFLEVGNQVFVEGDLCQAVDEGVRLGYSEGYLRKSVVADPLKRVNTGDNTPAMLYTEYVPGDKIKITVAPKGFGSENMSGIKMLRPSDGVEGVKEFVLSVVREAGPNPCPPIVVGVGIGGTFDKAALLAKKALLRPIGKPDCDGYYTQLEEELINGINELGIGPQGFGGKTTALAVHIETMPTHIAALPCAVNINCHVSRHVSEVL